MLWYGKYNKLNFSRIYKRRKLSYNRSLRRLNFFKNKNFSLNFTSSLVLIPANFSILIFKHQDSTYQHVTCFFYSSKYYVRLVVPADRAALKVDINISALFFKGFYTPSSELPLTKYFNNLFKVFTSRFFRKLKIKGKGYYIYKNSRNTITHQFGHSHRLYIYSYFVVVKFLSKTSVFLFGSSKKDIFFVSKRVKSSKPLNIFTGRGVRFTRQVIYKKTGKVSAYR